MNPYRKSSKFESSWNLDSNPQPHFYRAYILFIQFSYLLDNTIFLMTYEINWRQSLTHHQVELNWKFQIILSDTFLFLLCFQVCPGLILGYFYSSGATLIFWIILSKSWICEGIGQYIYNIYFEIKFFWLYIGSCTE